MQWLKDQRTYAQAHSCVGTSVKFRLMQMFEPAGLKTEFRVKFWDGLTEQQRADVRDGVACVAVRECVKHVVVTGHALGLTDEQLWYLLADLENWSVKWEGYDWQVKRVRAVVDEYRCFWEGEVAPQG